MQVDPNVPNQEINVPDQEINVPNQEINAPQPNLIRRRLKPLLLLIRFYRVAVSQYIGVLIISELLQINELADFFIVKKQSSWWGENYSFTDYLALQQNSQGLTQTDYASWKSRLEKEYFHYEFNLSYILVLGLFTVLTLSFVILKRYRWFAQHQKVLHYTQTIFLGILLGGFAAVSKNEQEYSNRQSYIRWILIGFMLHAYLIFTLARFNKYKHYRFVAKRVACMLFAQNYAISWYTGYFSLKMAIIEIVIVYCLLYFNQLNYSILFPKKLPKSFNLVKKVKEWINAANAQDQNQNLFKFTKQNILILTLVVGCFGIWLSCIVFSKELFIVVTIIALTQPIILLFDTQVVVTGLRNKDIYMAVSSVYLDMACPIRNIIRAVQK